MSHTDPIGPFLFLDHVSPETMRLSAIFIGTLSLTPKPICTVDGAQLSGPAVQLVKVDDRCVWRLKFDLPIRPETLQTPYCWNGSTFHVVTDITGDLRIGFVSCNGEEHGDLDRPANERNEMWRRLCDDHDKAPFALLIHGGDQVYADEATRGHKLSDDWPNTLPEDPSDADVASLKAHLRARFFDRYVAVMTTPEIRYLCARVPSLMQWDDHDICDGWGSLQRSRTYSPVGQCIFDVAREMALAFQHGASQTDRPPRMDCATDTHLGWQVTLPGLRIVAPDLRSERTRRSVIGESGWAWMEARLSEPFSGRTLLVSSVPLLGPRLSLLERVMMLLPSMQKYEDDLRDQWQSRAHRAEWRRMLQLVKSISESQGDITVISGEIHLAARSEMKIDAGKAIHQLVASGISHRAPAYIWARILGALSRLGDAPLDGHPIRTGRIPGHSNRFVAERNYLVLERRAEAWTAHWHLEQSGHSDRLGL